MSDIDHSARPLPAIPQEHSNPFDQIDAVAPKGWRIKLAKAAAQLIAGTEKGAMIYGEMRDRLDTIEGRSIVSKALAESVAQQAVSDPEEMERAKARFLGSVVQKQRNLEAVIVGASQALPSLPPPSTIADPSIGQPPLDPPGDNAGHVDESEPLDPDWAATFTGIAENATTDELRQRLSRVLAGEIASPGTYTRATVRLIAELEQADILAMQATLPYVLAEDIIRTPGPQSSPNYSQLVPLLEAGLIANTGDLVSKTWPPAASDDHRNIVPGLEWALLIFMKSGHGISLPMVSLTKTGRAVADLLGRPDEREILRRIAAEIPSGSYSKILMGRTIDRRQVLGPVIQIFPEINFKSASPITSADPFNTKPIEP